MKRRFIVEIGMGIDQHGQNPTNAARKAVRDAITRNHLVGLAEVADLAHPSQMIVDVVVGVPYPEKVDKAAVLEILPYGSKSITVVEGGLIASGGRVLAELGDTSGDILIANAAVTVSVDVAGKD